MQMHIIFMVSLYQVASRDWLVERYIIFRSILDLNTRGKQELYDITGSLRDVAWKEGINEA